MSFSQRGYANKKKGQALEQYIEWCFKINGWELIRIADGHRQVSATKSIRVRQAFDYVAFGPEGRVLAFDVKCRSNGKRVTKSMIASTSGGSGSTRHQLNQFRAIQYISRKHRVGFLIYLSDVDEFYFVEDFESPENSTFIGSKEKGISFKCFT